MAALAEAARRDIEALQSTNVAWSEQPAPASGNADFTGGAPVRNAGAVRSLTLVIAVVPSRDESMTMDVGRNGNSILVAPISITSTTPAGARIAVPLAGPIALAVGDVLNAFRAYVAGASPRMTATGIEVVWG